MNASQNPQWEDLPPTYRSPGASREGPPPDPFRIGADDSEPDGEGPGGHGHQCVELCPICRAADLLRAGNPDLRGQLDDVGREALLTMRSLIDHYLERVDASCEERGRVEEIPID